MIQKLNNKLFFLNLLLMFSFSNIMSLGFTRYKTSALDINIVDKKLETKNPNICCEYKIFNKADCKKYLGRDQVLSKGYQPIQIKLTNNSDKPFRFSLNSFNLSCIPFYNFIEDVEFNTAKNVLYFLLLSQIVIPILSVPIFIIPFLINPASGAVFFVVAAPILGCVLFSLPIIEGIKSSNANKKLYDDFSRKSLNDQTVEPFSTINGLIFVSKKDFKFKSEISFVANS
jgi:hypothetical protein